MAEVKLKSGVKVIDGVRAVSRSQRVAETRRVKSFQACCRGETLRTGINVALLHPTLITPEWQSHRQHSPQKSLWAGFLENGKQL